MSNLDSTKKHEEEDENEKTKGVPSLFLSSFFPISPLFFLASSASWLLVLNLLLLCFLASSLLLGFFFFLAFSWLLLLGFFLGFFLFLASSSLLFPFLLLPCQELVAKGHEVTCFEASPVLGGVFNATYDNCYLTVSNYWMAFR